MGSIKVVDAQSYKISAEISLNAIPGQIIALKMENMFSLHRWVMEDLK